MTIIMILPSLEGFVKVERVFMCTNIIWYSVQLEEDLFGNDLCLCNTLEGALEFVRDFGYELGSRCRIAKVLTDLNNLVVLKELEYITEV